MGGRPLRAYCQHSSCVHGTLRFLLGGFPSGLPSGLPGILPRLWLLLQRAVVAAMVKDYAAMMLIMIINDGEYFTQMGI